MTTCVLDGEIVALGEDGRPSFSRLQQRMHVANQREAKRRAAVDPVSFVAFDLLYLDGHSLLDETYDDRRDAARVAAALSGETFTTTDSFRDVSGQDILDATVANGLEGVVAKRRELALSTGPAQPRLGEGQVVPDPGGGHRRLDRGTGRAGRQPRRPAARDPADDGLRYVGKVGTGFSDERPRRCSCGELRPLARRDEPVRRRRSPTGRRRAAHFVRPSLVGEVEFGEWTTAGRLRHPTWRGLRPDKAPDEVVVE